MLTEGAHLPRTRCTLERLPRGLPRRRDGQQEATGTCCLPTWPHRHRLHSRECPHPPQGGVGRDGDGRRRPINQHAATSGGGNGIPMPQARRAWACTGVWATGRLASKWWCVRDESLRVRDVTAASSFPSVETFPPPTLPCAAILPLWCSQPLTRSANPHTGLCLARSGLWRAWRRVLLHTEKPRIGGWSLRRNSWRPMTHVPFWTTASEPPQVFNIAKLVESTAVAACGGHALPKLTDAAFRVQPIAP